MNIDSPVDAYILSYTMYIYVHIIFIHTHVQDTYCLAIPESRNTMHIFFVIRITSGL